MPNLTLFPQFLQIFALVILGLENFMAGNIFSFEIWISRQKFWNFKDD
jgi:hypothetical protein